MSMKTVKHVIKQIVKPITHISNRSFPNSMKLAKIIPAFKSGDRFQLSNYRPIFFIIFFKNT